MFVFVLSFFVVVKKLLGVSFAAALYHSVVVLVEYGGLLRTVLLVRIAVAQLKVRVRLAS